MLRDKMVLAGRLLMVVILSVGICSGCTSRALKKGPVATTEESVTAEEHQPTDPEQDQVIFRGRVITAEEKQAILNREQEAAAAEEKHKQEEIARYLSEGRKHLKAGQWDNAIETFNQLLLLDAGHGEARALLAKAEQGKKEEVKKPVSNDLGMKFVWIQPGTFTMGSPENEQGRYDDEKQHQVTLIKGFYLQITEVTQAQWKKVMGNNPAFFKDCGENCPVEQVSWNDVQEFIRKLNQKIGRTYRLPTEAEWEYACRAGTNSPFHTGPCLTDAQANYDSKFPLYGCPRGRLREKPVPVKSFAPNAWGLYDMHGNVWEWCSDWYGDYPAGSVTDPTGPSSGDTRVNRGGSWNRDAIYCRSAIRSDDAPDSRFNNLGFRLVTTP